MASPPGLAVNETVTDTGLGEKKEAKGLRREMISSRVILAESTFSIVFGSLVVSTLLREEFH